MNRDVVARVPGERFFASDYAGQIDEFDGVSIRGWRERDGLLSFCVALVRFAQVERGFAGFERGNFHGALGAGDEEAAAWESEWIDVIATERDGGFGVFEHGELIVGEVVCGGAGGLWGKRGRFAAARGS
jgi:hypothetical protein